MEITRGSKLFINKIDLDLGNSKSEAALDYGSKNGELAEALGCYFADFNIGNKNELATERCFYVSDLKQIAKEFSTVIFTANYSSELNNMIVEEIMDFLPQKGTLYIILSKNYSLDNLGLLPWKYNIMVEDKEFWIIRIIKNDLFPIDPSKYLKKFSVGILDIKIDLVADPSVFSNKGVDKGTEALLEKVQWKAGPLLDIGCGSGVIGIVANKMTQSKITMVDVNLRALQYARDNADKNHVTDVEVLANYGFKELNKRNYYETILSNPPYHSDYSVAKEFIEEGYKMLKIGGTMWFVVKNPLWYQKKFLSVFGGVKVIEHQGYTIVYAEKKPLEKKDKPPKTTKKHHKRMENSKKRKHKS